MYNSEVRLMGKVLEGRKKRRQVKSRSVELAALLTLLTFVGILASGVRSASAGTAAIIDNGTVQMGINPAGDLNVPGGTPSGPSSVTTTVGLRYIPTNADALSPGCLCEGWGVANADAATVTFGGAANESTNPFAPGLVVVDALTGVTVTTGKTRAESVGSAYKSVVTAGPGRVRVTHNYHPSASPNLYQIDITIENIGSTSIGDLRYRRVLDWDIEPFVFSEFVEIHLGTAPNLLRATTDGFRSANPLDSPGPFAGAPPTTLTGAVGSTDYSGGPADQGSLFDFSFGMLGPGESITFTLFYGAAGTRADALAAISAVGATSYSLGIPRTSTLTASTGGPNIFIFAFGPKASTRTAITSSTNPSVSGQAVTFTATVTAAGGGTPTGTVQFTIDGVNFGSPVTVTGGTAASGATSSLSAGAHSITATYVGDANFNTSTSTVLSQVVKASTSTAITSSATTSVFGQSVTFTATVTAAGGGTPTGTVQF
ncbi:MAG TPA: Ig-like domain repeat protein, partial [Methylomirabilota bacterium]|nr:Ig-like domain repeat protein [Methylomirabilota bacterium]